MTKVTDKVPNESIVNNNDIVQQLLQQHKEMQAELNALKSDKEKKPHDPDEIYNWPHTYSYQTYGGRIVVDIEWPFKGNKAKPLAYHNKATGEDISNHFINVYFSDKDSQGKDFLFMDVIEYGMDMERSKKIFSKSSSKKEDKNGKETVFHTFEIDGEDVEISFNCLN